jgi:hypothetical protein
MLLEDEWKFILSFLFIHIKEMSLEESAVMFVAHSIRRREIPLALPKREEEEE